MMIRPDGLTATSSDARYVCVVLENDAGSLIRGLLAFFVALTYSLPGDNNSGSTSDYRALHACPVGYQR